MYAIYSHLILFRLLWIRFDQDIFFKHRDNILSVGQSQIVDEPNKAQPVVSLLFFLFAFYYILFYIFFFFSHLFSSSLLPSPLLSVLGLTDRRTHSATPDSFKSLFFLHLFAISEFHTSTICPVQWFYCPHIMTMSANGLKIYRHYKCCFQ